MKKEITLLAVGLLLAGIVACKTDKNSDGNKPNDGTSEVTGQMSKKITDQCAKYDNEQEATICASDEKETWSVYCYDGEAFPDYSENCSAQGMGCKNLEFTNGTFGICTCTSASQCTTNIEHADPVCTERGECRFQCHTGYHETTVKIVYEADELEDISYKCAEDYETPADVGSFCNNNNDGYYCFESSSGDTWQIYCDNHKMDQGYSQNCTSFDEVCGAVEKNGKTYNICKATGECLVDSDCQTEVENALPWCNTESSSGNLCSYKCNDGYTDDLLSGGCEAI